MKKFMFASIGLLCLALSALIGFHVGHRTATAQVADEVRHDEALVNEEANDTLLAKLNARITDLTQLVPIAEVDGDEISHLLAVTARVSQSLATMRLVSLIYESMVCKEDRAVVLKYGTRLFVAEKAFIDQSIMIVNVQLSTVQFPAVVSAAEFLKGDIRDLEDIIDEALKKIQALE